MQNTVVLLPWLLSPPLRVQVPGPGPPSAYHPSPHQLPASQTTATWQLKTLALMLYQPFSPNQALSSSSSAVHPLLLWEPAQAQWCQ